MADAVVVDPGDTRIVTPIRDLAILGVATLAANQTRVLGTPTHVGQRFAVALSAHGGGNLTVTQSGTLAINSAGNTIATFAAAGRRVTFLAIALGNIIVWRVESFDGATFS